jgi:hypothetical protein
MTALVYFAVGAIIFLYFWVWSREPEQEQVPEPPVIDRRRWLQYLRRERSGLNEEGVHSSGCSMPFLDFRS